MIHSCSAIVRCVFALHVRAHTLTKHIVIYSYTHTPTAASYEFLYQHTTTPTLISTTTIIITTTATSTTIASTIRDGLKTVGVSHHLDPKVLKGLCCVRAVRCSAVRVITDNRSPQRAKSVFVKPVCDSGAIEFTDGECHVVTYQANPTILFCRSATVSVGQSDRRF